MRPLLLFVLFFLVLPAGATTYTVCSSGCDAVNLSEANALAIDGDLIDIRGAFQVENMNVISKNVTVEGNDNRITIAMPSYDSFGLHVSAPAVLNNISIDIVNTWAGAIKMENVTAKNWSNIHIEVNDSLALNLPKSFPDSAGVFVLHSNYSKISNLTTKNVYAPLRLLFSNNFTSDINVTATRNYTGESILHAAVYLDDSIHDTISVTQIQGYNNGIRIGALTGSSTITTRNITIQGTGRIHGNTYGIRGAVDNLTIADVNLDGNTYDMSLWGMTTYNLSNITASRVVLLPNGQELNVTNYALNKITINGTEYDVSAGYSLTATLTGSPPYGLELGYNKTKTTELDINVSTLRVFHEITGNGNETLAPSEINSNKGTLKVQVNSLSPFYIFGSRNPSSSNTAVQTGGSGGYYDPEWYNADGSRKTPIPTITATATPTLEKIIIPAPETAQPIILTPDLVVPEQAEPSAPEPIEPVSSSGFTIIAGLIVLGGIILVYKFKTKQK